MADQVVTAPTEDKAPPADREAAGLLALREAIDRRLAALAEDTDRGLVGTDAGSSVTLPTKSGQRGGWIEWRIVNGCGPYAYRRWWEGGRKRTRYLGRKVQ